MPDTLFPSSESNWGPQFYTSPWRLLLPPSLETTAFHLDQGICQFEKVTTPPPPEPISLPPPSSSRSSTSHPSDNPSFRKPFSSDDPFRNGLSTTPCENPASSPSLQQSLIQSSSSRSDSPNSLLSIASPSPRLPSPLLSPLYCLSDTSGRPSDSYCHRLPHHRQPLPLPPPRTPLPTASPVALAYITIAAPDTSPASSPGASPTACLPLLRQHLQQPLRQHLQQPLRQHLQQPLRQHLQQPLRQPIPPPPPPLPPLISR
ncbi:hypothetical protein BDZ91DRAFT_336279 [Kalaharituber pfeilii]|nr:hypothetical protein BDZ91DRAFT_336279 [Kalaharituber pfeilii]